MIKDQVSGSLAKLFSNHIQRFDSEAEDSVQHSCNLIVKGLLLTCAVFPRFKVPTPLQWDARHSANAGDAAFEGATQASGARFLFWQVFLASGGRVVRLRYRR